MKKITYYITSIHTMSIVCDNALCYDEHGTTVSHMQVLATPSLTVHNTNYLDPLPLQAY